MKLALVANTDIPLDILLEGGPLKPVEGCAASRIKILVSDVIVGVAMKRRGSVKLMPALVLATPESPVHEKEVLRPSEQASAGRAIEVTGLLESREVVADEFRFLRQPCTLCRQWGWMGEVGGEEFDTESPDCGAVVSARDQGPTHDPKAKGKDVVDLFLWVVFFIFVISRLSPRQAVGSAVLLRMCVDKVEIEQ